MSPFTNSSGWQTDRASRFHYAFRQLVDTKQYEGGKLIPGLAAIAARLNGTPLSGGKILKASAGTVKRLWYLWNKNGRNASSLILNHASPKNVSIIPAELAREIQKLATHKTGFRDKNGNAIEAPAIRTKLEKRWHAGEALPGLGTWQEWYAAAHPGYAIPATPPEFPWSVRTVSRKMGPKALRAMGNVGHAAALKHMPSMKRDYSRLRKCELYTLDDVRLDLVAIDELSGKVVDITLYVLMEVASRCIVSFVLKPADALRQEDVDEMIAHGLQADGFGIGVGYQTHIWFERGTLACSEAAQRVLEAGSDDAIKIHRTSMDGGVSWIGAAADKASGHSAGKAAIESFNRNLHRYLLDLPGQRGNRFDHAPANLGVGDPNVKDASRSKKDTLVAAAEKIAQFKLTAAVLGRDARDMKLPLLTVGELQVKVREAMQHHNDRRGHSFQGFHKITEAETSPGSWQQVSTR